MTDEEGADQGVTYLAIVGRSSAYVLDMYPEERDRYLREMGNAVVSEFATAEEAEAVAARNLRQRPQETARKVSAA